MSDKPLVIIGDIINSRKIENRKEAQLHLNSVLDKVNEKYNNSLSVPFKITLGDEFVGVLEQSGLLLDLIQYLEVQLVEIDVRYGIGCGDFEAGNKGPGYERALKAVKSAKKNRFKVHLTAEKDNNYFTLINLILHLYFRLLDNHTGRQKYIVYQIKQGKTQKEIADLLDTSQSSISQSIKRINWRLLLKVNDMFTDLKDYLPVENNYFQGDYIALIGSLPEEEEGKLKVLLETLNKEFYNIIRSKFVTTSLSSEDKNYYEFQGLINNKVNFSQDLIRLIVELYRELNNLNLGIGIGDLSTEINEKAIGMDGEAFYRARKAIKTCFEEGMDINLQILDCRLNKLYTLIFAMFIIFIKDWSDKQYLAVKLRQTGLTQAEIIEKMNLSARSTLVEHLQRAGWQDYKYIVEQLAQLLDKKPTS